MKLFSAANGIFRLSVALLLFALGTISSGQTIDTDNHKLTVDVELVQLFVSVLDRHGIPIRGLQREHFTVYEDKAAQNISLFEPEDQPLSVAFVIDVSGSMSGKLDRLSAAASTFLRESNPEDETSIVMFGEDVVLEPLYTGTLEELNRAFTAIPSNRGTALYDAVFRATRHILDNGSHDKKVLVIISDGDDNSSKQNLNQVRAVIDESNFLVYTIGLLSSDSYDFGLPQKGKKVMKELAQGTQGDAFFPKNVDEVERLCKKIARDLRSQYTIGYRPSNLNLDGRWRKISVRVNQSDTDKPKVVTKQGYYAPSGTSQARMK